MAQEPRFIRRGVMKFYFLTTVAGTAPTREEIEEGLDLTPRIADLAGWMLAGSDADAQDLSSAFDKKEPGTTSMADSSLTLYVPKVGADTVRAALPRLTTGYAVLMGAGDVPTTGKMDTFPVTVRSVGDEYSMGNDLAKYQIQFSPSDEPRIGQPIPANT